VGDGALAALAGASGMQKMKLRDSSITSKGLVEHLKHFPELTTLDLSETKVGDEAMVAIGQLKKLEDLNLWHTRITDAGLAHLVDLPLKRLNLDDIYDVTDGSIEHISKMKGLEFLHLGKTGVTDEALQGLVGLNQLRELRLDNTVVSKKAVEQLKAACPNLTKVSY
jgi:Ran GTPase-activating protein (RanGAP) involved in mRNA processing and transport